VNAEQIRLRAVHLMDNVDAAAEAAMGPQCRVEFGCRGCRCILDAGHTGLCDVHCGNARAGRSTRCAAASPDPEGPTT
jgi:hypothetical protein